MSRSRRVSPFDSLELLLDTLCNTFGGILFISILVTVLLQMSHPKSEEESTDETTNKRDEIIRANLEEHLEDLKLSLQTQQSVLQSLHPGDWDAANEQRLLLEDALAEQLNKVGELAADIEQLKQMEREVKEQVENEGRTIADLEAALAAIEKEKKKSEEDVKESKIVPVASRTNRMPIAVVIRYGRFYVLHRYDNQARVGLNTADFLVLENSSVGIMVRPKASGGVPLDFSPHSIEGVRESLRQFAPERTFLDVVVRPDSYDAFAAFRKIATKLGFQYSVLPCSEDDLVFDRGGRDRYVQ